MQAQTEFWDRIAPRYARSPVRETEAYEATLARVKTYLHDTDTVVELGCGTGSTALILAPLTRSYVATDISAGMIAIARDKIAAAGTPNLAARQGGIAPAGDAGPDTVLAFNLLHLVDDVPGALRRIHDMLPPGGLFISKTPALRGKWYFRPLIAVMRALGKAPAVTFIGVDELDRAVEAAGFEIVETGLYPPSTPSRFIVARKPPGS